MSSFERCPGGCQSWYESGKQLGRQIVCERDCYYEYEEVNYEIINEPFASGISDTLKCSKYESCSKAISYSTTKTDTWTKTNTFTFSISLDDFFKVANRALGISMDGSISWAISEATAKSISSTNTCQGGRDSYIWVEFSPKFQKSSGWLHKKSGETCNKLCGGYDQRSWVEIKSYGKNKDGTLAGTYRCCSSLTGNSCDDSGNSGNSNGGTGRNCCGSSAFGNSYDQWCSSNCALGNCLSTYCTCN